MRFSDRVAIITGGGRGLGLAYAQALAAEGARVVVAELDEAAGRGAAEAIARSGGEALFVRTDVANEADTRDVAAATIRAFGRIDILVNNAAVFANLATKPVEDISVAEWDRVMAVNLRGMFLMAKAVLPQMKAQAGGSIVNISSNTVLSGAPLLSHYVASKAGVIGFTRSLAREVGGFGIRVNALTPGLTDTDAAKGVLPEDRFRIVTGLRALGRRQVPDDLVGPLLFLCSPDSGFVTGQVLNVDGGQILY